MNPSNSLNTDRSPSVDPTHAENTRDHRLRRLGSLFRGECAAVATYAQAIEKDGAAKEALSGLRDEHSRAAAQIERRIVALGGTVPDGGGIWVEFAKAIEGAAKVFGNAAALAALKLGESHGVDKYADAVGDPVLDPESRDVLRDSIARQKSHLSALDALRGARS
jgi:hypothetical protein